MLGDAYYQLPTGRVLALDMNDLRFPPVEYALTHPNGLVAIGGDLSPARILEAYKQGIFPWFNEGDPYLWWSPDPRMVLYPQELKISRSLSKTLRNKPFEVRFNTAFKQVMQCCASTFREHQDGSWITQEIIEAYTALHDMGYAISAETWLNNSLVGGLYGVKIGAMFYGESMFHHVTDASKVAFVHLVNKLTREGVKLIDCQMETTHLSSLGARPIARLGFLQALKNNIHLQSS